jgi:hypothetical protein
MIRIISGHGALVPVIGVLPKNLGQRKCYGILSIGHSIYARESKVAQVPKH